VNSDVTASPFRENDGSGQGYFTGFAKSKELSLS
jgi:hypothetical protein